MEFPVQLGIEPDPQVFVFVYDLKAFSIQKYVWFSSFPIEHNLTFLGVT